MKKQRIEHHMALQTRLRSAREEAHGDPIRGASKTTSFVTSLREALSPSEKETVGKPIELEEGIDTLGQEAPLRSVAAASRLNHFLTPGEMKEAFAVSRAISKPYFDEERNDLDPELQKQMRQQHDIQHIIATQAIERIVSVENTSSGQKRRINKQRIIDKFGRHNTDLIFESRMLKEGEGEARAGVDTGSSEVQIGILTDKIQTLADRYQNGHKKDKHNKRNLRVLLHRRQKLLKYLYRKDRGGERWQHCISTLGLTPATWEGEIEVR